ncbi:MAG: DUF4145 domain-containing protein [Lachnospiraceae bacterium]|nr:DUF4145 domain-containing protein [Lachnospiraceae bacterium]
MERLDLKKLSGLAGHPELKENMEGALRQIGAGEYRAAASELRQALEYMVDCYLEAAREEDEVPGNLSLYNRIEFLKSGDWITFSQADSFHSIRMRCNAGVHRNADPQKKQMTPADIRYCYELLVQELPDFLAVFPGEEQEVPEAEAFTEEPAAMMPVEVPEAEAFTEEPAAMMPVEIPEAGALTEEPAATGPAEKPAVPEPAEKPAVMASAEKPEALEPVAEPAAPIPDLPGNVETSNAETSNLEIPKAGRRRPEEGYSILQDRSGEASEDVFSDMMRGLLKKLR